MDQDKALKACVLEMLDIFISTCESLNLRYYVLAGTLLGAVRHKGFIPWDDDIDVGMPRKDYEIWLEKAQSLMPPDFFLQSYKTDQQFPHCFAKIRNSNTTFIEKALNKLEINHGIYLDVFPLDYYPDSSFEIKKLKLKQNFYISKIYQCLNLDAISYSKSKMIMRKILSIAVSGSPFDAVKKLDRLYRNYPKSANIVNFCGAWGDKEISPVEWFGEGSDYMFEGRIVKGPKEYDKYLTKLYGNYMQLPPIEKRVSHHFSDVIDTEMSYTEYVKKG